MSKIPTAKLILTGKETYDSEYPTVSKYDALEAMIEFAKLHVEAQQEAILKVLENRGEHNNIDKNIIINSYPLNLIK